MCRTVTVGRAMYNGDHPMTTPFLIWHMKPLSRCILWSLLFYLFVSCTNRYVANVLVRAEQIMDSGAPDSAWVCLNTLRAEEIPERRLKARLSLDRAMALDKRYVDTNDISILTPALNYYKGPFHKRERYLTAYYQGRILENGSQDQDALKAFTQAGILATRSRDSLYMVRICAAKARLYLRNLAFRQAEDAIDEGLRWCSPESPNWQVLMLDKIEHQLARRQYDQADSLLKSLPPSSFRWLEAAIRLCRAYPACREDYEDILKKSEPYLPHILPVVQAEYLLMKGEAFQAMEVLESDNPQTISEKTTHFLARRDAEIETGNIEAALQSFRAYTSGLETWFTKVSNQDVRYIEEKYQQWVREQKHHQRSVLYLLLAVLALVGLLFRWIHFRTKRKAWERKVEQLRAEYEGLLRWRNQLEEKNRQVSGILDTRIRALAPFLSQDLPFALDRSPELDRLLTDRKDILSNIGLLFALYHPAFVQELESYGLDYIEMGFCCLYALGLRVNEIPEVIGRDAYHVNPHIRKKVGLDSHDTNLPNWVRDLFARTG